MEYSKLTVVKLKEELKARGIASTGLLRKQQIIDRLVEEDAKQNGESDAAPEEDALEPVPESATTQAEGTPAAPQPVSEPSPDPEVQTENKPPESPSSRAPVEEDVDGKAADDTDQAECDSGEHKPAEAASGAQKNQEEVPEANKPLPTPTNGMQAPEISADVSDEVTPPSSDRKRKRRSASPPITEAEVAKKLKQDDTAVVHVDADVEMQSDKGEAQEPDRRADHETDTQAGRDVENKPEQRQQDEHKPEPESSDVVAVAEEDSDTLASVSPAIHPATSSLYVRNLKRPLQIQSFKQHLLDLAQEADALSLFHLDTIRTHAFARFVSVKAASRVRSKLHDQIWPHERDREPLWVDFVPDEQVEAWVAVETQGSEGGRGANMRRWEVAYSREQDGSVTATLQEASEVASRQPFYSDNRAVKQPRAPPQPVPENKQPAPVAFANLDQRFKSTATKPKLYWLPVAQKLADARLDEIDAMTTRRGTYPDSGSGWNDSRRYTFEEGDRLVDGGPEFGLRQGRSRAAPGARRGRQGARGRGGDGWR